MLPFGLQEAGGPEPITFQHAAAERTGAGQGTQDLVSACLLFHELPQSAAHDIMQEAYWILKPGGVLAVMVITSAVTCILSFHDYTYSLLWAWTA